MRIAIVSTGLGHVARGVEAWARELARNLAAGKAESGKWKAERGKAGLDVTLFGAAEISSSHVSRFTFHVIPCLKRGAWIVRAWVKMAPAFTWRCGWKSGYAIEQKSFARHLIPHLKNGEYDVVHTQDVVLALELEKARKNGVINTPTILAHGTDEGIAILSQFEYLQHLSPDYEEKVREELLTTDHRLRTTNEKIYHFCIPNFVDTERFLPGGSDLRGELGIPSDALVIGCSAALQFHHKRLDYLIREVAKVTGLQELQGRDFYLFLAGASTDETAQVEALAADLLGDRCKILKNLPFDEMPEFYRALDLYVHPAAEEFFGICFLEAMACGKAVVAHSSPTLKWIVGANSGLQTTDHGLPAGKCVDMNEEGVVREFLERVTGEWMEEHGRQARERVEEMFSWEAVEPRFLEMYKNVAGKE